jgi:hypothetical protein
MDKQLRRILNLVRKTGDRMVVTDTNGDDVYVVMGLEQYEHLVDPSAGSSDDDDEDWNEGWWKDGPDLDKPSGGPNFLDDLTDDPETFAQPPKPPGTSARADSPSVQASPVDIWEAMRPAGETGETWDIAALSDREKVDLERQFEAYQNTKKAETSEKPETSERENQGSKNDEDFGEEQFYLEPVE